MNDKNNMLQLFKPGTDCYFILEYLINHEGWRNVIDIIKSKSFSPERPMVNWACRSRISDINKKIGPHGWTITSRIGSNGQGEYMLVGEVMALLKQEICYHKNIDKETRDKVEKHSFSIDDLLLIKRHLDEKPVKLTRTKRHDQLEIPL